MSAGDGMLVIERCPNPYCDGRGWVTASATATANAYKAPACSICAERRAADERFEAELARAYEDDPDAFA